MTTLTIVLTENCEHPPEYMDRYLGSLREWNQDGLTDSQLLIISQKPDIDDAMRAVGRFGIEADIVHAENEFVGDRPIWDLLASLRKAWPIVGGQYVTFNHTEFIWCPGRLLNTINWLKQNKPYVALGNLMRPASARSLQYKRPPWRPGNCERVVSDQLTRMIDAGKWQDAAQLSETIPTAVWPLWSRIAVRYGRTPWQEDAFCVDREWADACRLIRMGGEQPFQDIFDLMGIALERLSKYQAQPHIYRMPQEANRIIHSWHSKPYSSWTPDVRDWFRANPGRWRGTCLMNPKLWNGLLTMFQDGDVASNLPKYDLRRGPGGTVTRYAADMDQYVRNGGSAHMREFYERYGRYKRA